MKQLLIILLLAAGLHSFAQNATTKAGKPVLDTSVFNKWPSVGDGQISPDGQYFAYTINNRPAGSHTLVVQSTRNSWKREFSQVDLGKISSDSKRFIFKTAGDSLCIGQLGSDTRQYIANVNSFKMIGTGRNEWLVYQVTKPAGQLYLQNLDNGHERHYSAAEGYTFSKQGEVLLLQTRDTTDHTHPCRLAWINMADGRSKTIWQGESAFNTVFNAENNSLAFMTKESKGNQEHHSIWYYNQGMERALIKVNDGTPGIEGNLQLDSERPVFDPNGDRIYFRLIEKELPKAKPGAVPVEVWSYTDRSIQPYQQLYDLRPKTCAAVLPLNQDRVIRLEQENEELIRNADECKGNQLLVQTLADLNNHPERWQKLQSSVYIISTLDGSRSLLKDNVIGTVGEYFDFPPSHNGKWFIYFDPGQQAYFSYEVATGTRRNITGRIPVSLTDHEGAYQVDKNTRPSGAGAWLHDDSAVLIYDDYDIWKVDPLAQTPPINITKGYGRSHHIRLRPLNTISKQGELLLGAFNYGDKTHGFFYTGLDGKQDPEALTMGPYEYSVVMKARDKNSWLIERWSPTEAPNYFTTTDFKTYKALSDLQPQKEYNWLTAELVNWTLPNGQPSQGKLYKPENFDPSKKYPLIFQYYQKQSQGLFDYLEPQYSDNANIDIPWYVSRGYLVFLPDIQYETGHSGESIVNSVVSAANYLTKQPWVDSKRMGINGHSWGGYETNYLLTHSRIFAAAAEGAGVSDLISDYGSTSGTYQLLSQNTIEVGYNRIGGTLWQKPELYIENSPVLKADQVTTPLLIMHNKADEVVPWTQAVELYLDLRRLGKKVWLLQYDQEGHGIHDPKNRMDYTTRLSQFFDHYLKDAPPPRWMTEGIPARLKGVESRLELDTSGKQP